MLMSSKVFSGSNDHYWREKNINNAGACMRSYGDVPEHDPDFRRRLVPNNPNLTRPPALPAKRPHCVSHNASPLSRAAPSPAPASTSYSDSVECVTFHLSSYSRRELKDLTERMIAELNQVRALRTRIDGLHESRRQVPASPYPGGPITMKSVLKGSTNPAAAPARSPLYSVQVSKLTTKMMRKCSQMLKKLMTHKHGWVFNKPVDVISLGLHDYLTIIRNPMDLGTVNLRMSKKEYRTPLDFAGDVKLTFNNAIVYNPKGQDVYDMAQELLTLFESMFNPAFQKYESEISGMKKAKPKGGSLPVEPVLQYPLQVGSVGLGAKAGKTEKPKVRKRDSNGEEKSRKNDMKAEKKLRKRDLNGEEKLRKKDMKAEKKLRKREEKLVVNVEVESRKVDMRVEVESCKKDMSFEEKSRLVIGLQELPQSKLDEMVKIINKRNMHSASDSDEIELDIELIDNETLWELDGLVKDHEKMVESNTNGESSPQFEVISAVQHEFLLGSEHLIEQKKKMGDAGEEDVDIGDEVLINFPPLQIEKDGSSSGSSSSSSSDSSSFSDSDSVGSDLDGGV